MKTKSPFYNFMHMGLVVRDIEKAVKGLEKFGIGPFEKTPDLKGAPIFRGKPSDAKVKGLIAHMGGIELELNQPVEGATSQQEYIESKGEGIHHIGFLVKDLEEESAYLTEKGIDVMLSGAGEGEKWKYFDMKTCGLVLQLTEKQTS
jgi:methylmalonyl-CoA/ethylmalonyl-CoA epimerase